MSLFEELENIRDIDVQMFKVEQKSGPYLEDLIKNNSIRETAELFIIYISHMNFIKSSIFDCAEKEQIYSLKILFRSLIEHYFRFNFLFFEYTLTKSDKTSKEYHDILQMSEQLELLKAANTVRSLSNKEEVNFSEVWEQMAEKFPEYKYYSRGQIEEGKKKFSIKNISRYIENQLKLTQGDNHYLSSLITEYAEVSSYTHGGIFAVQQMIGYSDKKIMHEEIINLAYMSLHMGAATKYFSYLAFSKHNKYFSSLQAEMDILMKSFIPKDNS